MRQIRLLRIRIFISLELVDEMFTVKIELTADPSREKKMPDFTLNTSTILYYGIHELHFSLP